MSAQLALQSIKEVLPVWLTEETQYAERKYGFSNNPQRTIFQNGLRSGGEAYQEYFRYFSAWKIFTEQADTDRTVLLLAGQASLKFLNVSRATLCFAINDQTGLNLVESNKSALAVLHTEISRISCVQDVDNPEFVTFQTEILEPSLEIMAFNARHNRSADLLIESTVSLFRAQAELVIGHIMSHGLLATPGMPSGNVSIWDNYTTE